MKTLKLLIPLALAAGLSATPVGAQGRIGLLDQGHYVCALPGDAAGSAWIEQEGKAFAITGGSSYRTDRGAGTYLLEGKQVTFTRGPLKGLTLLKLGSGLLQEMGKDGKLSRLRCHRTGPLSN